MKRSGFKRKPPKRDEMGRTVSSKPLKPRICRYSGCKQTFTPKNGRQTVCSLPCSWKWADEKAERKAKAAERKAIAERAAARHAEKKAHREQDRGFIEARAKAYFHAWVRYRDRHDPCISSGRVTASKWNAGHYRPSGGNSALRYHEDNVHKQSSEDNLHLSGNLSAYRLRLIEKIGLERVEWLEGPHPVKKWTDEELIAIYETYRAKLKEAGLPAPTVYWRK